MLPRSFAKQIAAAWILAASLGWASTAQAADLLKVGAPVDYPPFSSRSSDGAFAGFDITVIERYAAERQIEIQWVAFEWPKLVADLLAERYDVAVGGITVRPERSVAGRFTTPVAQTGAVVLVAPQCDATNLAALDNPERRIAVNAGGHLERISRRRFRRAWIGALAGNDTVRAAVLDRSFDAVVTDTAEVELWSALDPAYRRIGPFTRDLKAYLVHPRRTELAEDLDTWLADNERDGTLTRLRFEVLPSAIRHPTASDLGRLAAVIRERTAIMRLVAQAKAEAGLDIEDRSREDAVLDAAVERLREGLGREPSEGLAAATRSLLAALVDVAKATQRSVGPPSALETSAKSRPAPDLVTELRPALDRIGHRVIAAVLALPADTDATRIRAAIDAALSSFSVDKHYRAAVAGAVYGVVTAHHAGEEPPGAED